MSRRVALGVPLAATRSPRDAPRRASMAGRPDQKRPPASKRGEDGRKGEQVPLGARETVLVAEVENESFRSDDGRFAVLRVTTSKGASLTVVGDVAGLSPGETGRFHGRHEEHATYGQRFVARSYTPVIPTTKAGIIRFLGSGLVPGVGPRLAEKLVERFGDQTLDVIAAQSARLREVPGIGKKKATGIADAIRGRRADAEALSFLHGLGLGPAIAKKLLTRYGTHTAAQMRDDPYVAAEEIAGIGFATADRIGSAAGIGPDDPRRAAGAVVHLLARAADQGHVFLPRDALAEAAVALGIPAVPLQEATATLAAREMVVVDGERVYAPPLYDAERSVAGSIRRLRSARKRSAADLSRALSAIRNETLADKQLEGTKRSLEFGLVVLTGGPGTGKTTTLRSIVRAHEVLGHRIALCAPTGRAAKRMSEASGREARTIHRLLEWTPGSATFRFGRDEPIAADLVVVDEASMLDIRLADALFAAVADEATLVLVGDVDQLPPVGAGQVLREVIASEEVPVVRLDVVFRQAQASAIVRGAHEILSGKAPSPSEPHSKGAGELFIVRAMDAEQAGARVVDVLRRIAETYQLDPVRDVQVLTPMRKGPLGTQRLNEQMQLALNPDGRGAGRFRVGDKVMQLQNDYSREVWNGDLGRVHKVEAGVVYVRFEDRETSYNPEDLDALTLAYASTIHKSQGSEFPAVVVVMHGAHHVMLSRPLLYTAITRAKQLAVLVGDPRAIARAAKNGATTRTFCALAERIRADG